MSAWDDLLTKAKSLADRNSDGKIDSADFDELRQGVDDETGKKLAGLQEFADKNNDGKVDLDDVRALRDELGKNAGSTVDDLKTKASDVWDDARNAVGDAFNSSPKNS